MSILGLNSRLLADGEGIHSKFLSIQIEEKGELMPKIPWVVKCSSCEQLKTVPMKPGKGFLCVPCLMGIDFYNLIYGDMGLVDGIKQKG